MIHKMKLYPDAYKAIKEKAKTIEMRLYDDKRKNIKLDDIIEFTNVESNEIMHCKVVNLYKYQDFDELYKNHNKISIGYKENECANPEDMLTYYSKEAISKYGVLGIEISLIKG